MILASNQEMRLAPFGGGRRSTCYFPEESGVYRCKISVKKGTIQFRHLSYSPYDQMWVDETPIETPRTRVFTEGESEIFSFTLHTIDQQPDHIIFSNRSFFRSATFTCEYERIADFSDIGNCMIEILDDNQNPNIGLISNIKSAVQSADISAELNYKINFSKNYNGSKITKLPAVFINGSLISAGCVLSSEEMKGHLERFKKEREL